MGSFRSWRTVLIAFAAILAMTVAIGGCFGGGGSSGAVLKVWVTEIDIENELRTEAGLLSSGPGVQHAAVTLVGTGQTATTNYLGECTFANVSPGTYDVAVVKEGMASTTAYNVYVSPYGTNEVELRMVKPPERETPIPETVPPMVYVSCQSTEQETKDVSVSASDSSGMSWILLFIDNLYVSRFGMGTGVDPHITGTYLWNTVSGESAVDNGEHTITAIAIDNYGNIGYRSIVVTVDNLGYSVEEPSKPTNVKSCAATIHYSVIDLLNGLEEKYEPIISSSLADRILALVKNLNKTTSLVRPLAMPAGSEAVAFCQVTWQTEDRLDNLSGFKIYRDGVFIGESPSVQAGSTSLLIGFPDPPAQTGYYIDGSSKLTPNVPVSYRVSAYNRWGEGDKSSSATTTPLGALEKVVLGAPVQGTDEYGDYLEFTWPYVTNAELYVVRIIDDLNGTPVHEASGTYNLVRVYRSGLNPDDNHHLYVLAINSIPSPPPGFDPNTWSPSQMSVSASELRSLEW